ncbi:MAG TPA: XRE family transcriptional regulator [Planctomycetota bacterium]|nr:XRE family transcriptional regulator [Planctomycetota bacterium]
MRSAAAPANPFCEQVRKLRAARGWSLEQLAAASGVSRSMLSQIERGRVNPTVAVAQRIAAAFEVSLGSLVDGPDWGAPIEVIRAADRAYHFRTRNGCEIRTLSPIRLEKEVEFYELRFRPRGALKSAPHFAGTREILTVRQGTLRVTSGGEGCVLGAGDSAHYRADVPHSIENPDRAVTIAYLVVLYRPR